MCFFIDASALTVLVFASLTSTMEDVRVVDYDIRGFVIRHNPTADFVLTPLGMNVFSIKTMKGAATHRGLQREGERGGARCSSRLLWFLSCCTVVWFLPRCVECRRGLAMRKLSVCPPVCLFVKPVNCDITEERSVHILYHTKDHISLVFWEEEWLVGGDPFYLTFWVNWALLERDRRYSPIAPQP